MRRSRSLVLDTAICPDLDSRMRWRWHDVAAHALAILSASVDNQTTTPNFAQSHRLNPRVKIPRASNILSVGGMAMCYGCRTQLKTSAAEVRRMRINSLTPGDSDSEGACGGSLLPYGKLHEAGINTVLFFMNHIYYLAIYKKTHVMCPLTSVVYVPKRTHVLA